MFNPAILSDIDEAQKKMVILAFCNPGFVDIARKHMNFYVNRLTTLDPDDETFTADYKHTKQLLAGWRNLLQFAAENAPANLDWGREFERVLTELNPGE